MNENAKRRRVEMLRRQLLRLIDILEQTAKPAEVDYLLDRMNSLRQAIRRLEDELEK